MLSTLWEKRGRWLVLAVVALVVACSKTPATLSESEAEAIAYDAYVFSYPMLQNFKTLYARAVMQKHPFNRYTHRTRLLDPSFTTIVGPNNDTLYSAAWLDLRVEPLIISVPAVPDGRYYSLQFIDLYTHNFAYIGQRATGPRAGRYALVGPGWQGEVTGVDGVFHSESDLVFSIGRTLAVNEDDQKAALALQKHYLIQPYSEFRGESAPPAPEPLAIPPTTLEQLQTVDFIKVVNFLLQYAAVHPDDAEQFARFAKIGIAAGNDDPLADFSPAQIAAMERGVKRAWEDISKETLTIGQNFDGWDTTFNAFGDRATIGSQFMTRAAAAMMGLYGNSKQENNSFIRRLDKEGKPLNGSEGRYVLTFAPGELPPANAFWSITMYRMPEVLLVANPINRYSIGDRTAGVQYNEDGSLTLYIQHDAPEPELQSNWLPAPAGEFALALRVYLPEARVYQGQWMPPRITRR